MLTSPEGKYYVGQTKNLDVRLDYYRKLDCKGQKLLYPSLCKYGLSNHRLTILKRCAHSTLDKWEIYYINVLQSCYRDNPLGLNVLKESYEDYCKLKGIKPKKKRKRKNRGYSFY